MEKVTYIVEIEGHDIKVFREIDSNTYLKIFLHKTMDIGKYSSDLMTIEFAKRDVYCLIY